MVVLSLTSDEYPKGQHIVYVIQGQYKGKVRTYVGYTVNFGRRIRQHNGEIKGGAKHTIRARPWKLLCFVYGFKSHKEALSFEWYLGHRPPRYKCKQQISCKLRLADIEKLIEKWKTKYRESIMWVSSTDSITLNNFKGKYHTNNIVLNEP